MGNEQTQVDDFNVLPAFGGSGTPDLDHLAGSGKSTHLRTSTALMVRCTQRPWERLAQETAGTFFLPQQVLQVSLQRQSPGFVEAGELVPVVVGCGCFSQSWLVSGAQATSCSAGCACR